MTIIERVLLLQGIDLFADVTTEQLSFLATIAEELTFDPGKIICLLRRICGQSKGLCAHK